MKTTKGHLRNDIILVAVILLFVSMGGIYLYLLREKADTVKITVDGELYAEYSLSEDRTEDIITGENGENLNRLVIRDGRASVAKANCPDGICARHAEIYRDSESIVCLPHRVVITVVADEIEDAPDIVA